MHDLRSLPARTLLNEYAFYDGDRPIQHLAEFVNRLGYRKVTRKHPLGRDITTADVRRLLRDFLQDNPLFPTHRAPTNDDYRRIRIDIMTQTDGDIL